VISGADDIFRATDVGPDPTDPTDPAVRLVRPFAAAPGAAPLAAETAVDVHALLEVGLSQRDVIDANQVVAYFTYVNRSPQVWAYSSRGRPRAPLPEAELPATQHHPFPCPRRGQVGDAGSSAAAATCPPPAPSGPR